MSIVDVISYFSIEAFRSSVFSFAWRRHWRFFRNAFLGIVELKPSGNRVRHIVSSQDDAVAVVMGR